MSRTFFRRCAAVALLAFAIALLPGPDMLAADGTDKISAKGVVTSVKGQATLSGSFRVAKQGVRLKSVTVWAYPQNGGKIESAGATQIDNTKMTWGDAAVKNLASTTYMFRIEGKFSDGKTYIGFIASQVSGGSTAGWPTLNWNTRDSSPSSPEVGVIAATGIWMPSATTPPVTIHVRDNKAVIKPYLAAGGPPPAFRGGDVIVNRLDPNKKPSSGTWSAINITGLTPGQTYTTLMQAVGSDGNTYCAPVVSLTVRQMPSSPVDSGTRSGAGAPRSLAIWPLGPRSAAR